MVKVGIAGGSGYGGLELLHVLQRHSQADVIWISSQQHVGKEVADVYPSLRRLVQLRFSALEGLDPKGLDVLFLALPHGHAMKIVPNLPGELPVIDLSGDFRLSDPKVFESYYGFPHSCPQEQECFVYGLTELQRDRIKTARRIANPGCFATATILALYPLAQEGWIRGRVFIDAQTGSSGAGNSPGSGTHHPRRSNSFFPYKPFRHQHLPEIHQALCGKCRLVFQTYSAPFVRGIFASHYLETTHPVKEDELRELYTSYYGTETFIRWSPGCPDVNDVRHSNYVDIGGALEEDVLIVWSVLDNLQKGAAGQAVQNMNVMLGLPEEEGLDSLPIHP